MITQKECELLKHYHAKGYRWIVRDGDDERLYVHTSKPIKLGFSWESIFGCSKWSVNDNSLSFIKWEDEEPTKINDLVRDYESHQKNKQGGNNVNKKKLMKKYKDFLIMAAVFVAFILITALVYFLVWIILDEYIITLWDSLIYFLNK